ncbi:MAG TPA: GIY-YIG nuclease family protein [Longimicrobium sp.]
MHHDFYVYIMASRKRVLYVGMTNDLVRRGAQHRQHAIPGFTKRCNVDQLVYFEHTHDARAAIAREKEIKRWTRTKKVVLIESLNPAWDDLYDSIAAPVSAGPVSWDSK